MKGKPLTEIHPLHWEILVSMRLTSRWNLLRYTVDVAVLDGSNFGCGDDFCHGITEKQSPSFTEKA